MTNRTVINVMRISDQKYSFDADEATVELEASKLGVFTASCSDAVFAGLWESGMKADAVLSAGKRLYSELERQKKRAGFALATVLGQPKGDFPVQFILHPAAEEFPWEALYGADRFLALERWPVVRLVAPAVRPDRLTRTLDRELKVCVVLAAGAVSEDDEWNEWQNLRHGLSKLDPPPRFQVLLSNRVLKERIDKQADPCVITEFLGSASHLKSRVEAFAPNVIHFFCHARPGALTLATVSDREPRPNATLQREWSVALDDGSLNWTADLETLWLVILNCCESGKGRAGARSLGRRLVEMGVPATIAMRSELKVGDAHVFTRTFYEELTEQFSTLFSPPRVPTPSLFAVSEWARALCRPRKELVAGHTQGMTETEAAANSTEWLLPVLYAHRSNLELTVTSVKPDVMTVKPDLTSAKAGLSDDETIELRNKLGKFMSYRTLMAVSSPNPVTAKLDEQIASLKKLLGEAP
jgi:hypothetical protein